MCAAAFTKDLSLPWFVMERGFNFNKWMATAANAG